MRCLWLWAIGVEIKGEGRGALCTYKVDDRKGIFSMKFLRHSQSIICGLLLVGSAHSSGLAQPVHKKVLTAQEISNTKNKVDNYLAAEKYSECISFLNNLISKSEKNNRLLLLRGQTYLAMGRITEAVDDLTKAINYKDDYLLSHVLRAVAYEAQNLDEKALKDTEIVAARLKIGKKQLSAAAESQIYFTRSKIFDRQDQYEKALEALNKAVALVPSSVTYETRANLEMKFGRDEDAKTDYRKAIELDNTNKSALANLTEIYLTEGNDAAALKTATILLRLAPQEAYPHFTAGRAIVNLGELTTAQDAFKAASEPDMNDYETGIKYAEKLKTWQDKSTLRKLLVAEHQVSKESLAKQIAYSDLCKQDEQRKLADFKRITAAISIKEKNPKATTPSPEVNSSKDLESLVIWKNLDLFTAITKDLIALNERLNLRLKEKLLREKIKTTAFDLDAKTTLDGNLEYGFAVKLLPTILDSINSELLPPVTQIANTDRSKYVLASKSQYASDIAKSAAQLAECLNKAAKDLEDMTNQLEKATENKLKSAADDGAKAALSAKTQKIKDQAASVIQKLQDLRSKITANAKALSVIETHSPQ